MDMILNESGKVENATKTAICASRNEIAIITFDVCSANFPFSISYRITSWLLYSFLLSNDAATKLCFSCFLFEVCGRYSV
jgi:hypothetical protein